LLVRAAEIHPLFSDLFIIKIYFNLNAPNQPTKKVTLHNTKDNLFSFFLYCRTVASGAALQQGDVLLVRSLCGILKIITILQE